MPFSVRHAARTIRNATVGRVSKSALLTKCLPLSILIFFGTLIAAAYQFPVEYDWQKIVISKLSSPRYNPDGNLLASFGVMISTALALPFAGYVYRRLSPVWPRLGKWAGLAFAFGFVLMFLSMALQSSVPWHKLHERLARISTGFFIVGMFSCFICAVNDRARFGGRGSLPNSLAYCWALLTIVPVLVLAALGLIFLLGQYGGQVWAEDFRQSFRHTPLWHLAFWEWFGATVGFIFLTSSVALLPVRIPESPEADPPMIPPPSLIRQGHTEL